MSDIHRNTRQVLQKRFQQTDLQLYRCLSHLAGMRASLHPRDRDYNRELFQLLMAVEQIRIALLEVYRLRCGGPEDKMRNPGQIIEILENARPVPSTVR